MGGVHAITPFTLLDYPGEVACIIWFSKCNLRCVYCHNPEIVFGDGKISDATCLDFLEKRKGQLTGVVFSGGEPTLCKDLPFFAAKAKELGFKVKIDTNGANPDVIRDFIDKKLVDCVALDYKCPPGRAKELLGTDKFVEVSKKTLEVLVAAYREKKIDMEVRTTFHSDLMNADDLNQIIADLEHSGYDGKYSIQNIVSFGTQTIGNISKPQSEMDISKIKPSDKIQICFRNFPKLPATLEEALQNIK